MRFRTVQDVYQELAKQIGREPDQEVWELLMEDRYPNDVIEEDATIEEVVSRYRRLAKLRNGKKRTTQKELPADYRTKALSEILALDAAERPDVQEFRKLYLGDKLLTWEDAVSWIESQHQAADRPTQYAVVPLPEDATTGPGDPFQWLKQAAQKTLEERRTWPVSLQIKTIDYARPGDPWVHRFKVRLGSPLDHLRIIAEKLTKTYNWPAAAGTIFVLTGIPYLVPRARISTSRRGNFPALTTINIEVLASVPVQQVAEIYADTRRKLLGPGRRDPAVTQEWRAQLAVFVAEHNNGRSWREAMEIWNTKHQDRRNGAGYYDNPSTFARDGRQAYEKITGARLYWGKGKASPVDQWRFLIRQLEEEE